MAGFSLSYGVSRDYPCRFFTPLVIAVGLAFLALFSFINLASSGFTLVTQYTTDPNATVTQSWSRGMPTFFASKMKPSCQPSPINGQIKLATTNNALSYTVTSVQSYGNGTLLPSLVYLNNPFESCNVSQVAIYMENAGGRTSAQIAVTAWGITVLGMFACRVELDDGPVIVNMTAEWDPYPASITTFTGYTTFLGRNKTSRASLYWGESLLANHRIHLNNAIDDVAEADHRQKSEITFTVRGSGEDITDLSFFNISSRSQAFLINEDKSSWNTTGVGVIDDDLTVGSLVDDGWTHWLAADNLAKSFMGVVLTDLGQTTAKHNILRDPVLLQHFTSNFSEILQGQDTRGSGPILEDYDTSKSTTGPLGVSPSTLAVNYLYNVPQRKPWSELIVSILVADLVFMRALWSIFTLIMSGWVKSKEKTGNWCEGCLSLASLPDEGKDAKGPAKDLQDDGDSSLGIPRLRFGSRASFQGRSGHGR